MARCEAKYFGEELNVQCSLTAGHPNQHIGAPAEGGEGMMWKDSEPMTEELVDEGDALWWLPPLGADVIVTHVDNSRTIGVLRASVVNESGAIVAVLIDYDKHGPRRALLAWRDVCGISWDRTSSE